MPPAGDPVCRCPVPSVCPLCAQPQGTPPFVLTQRPSQAGCTFMSTWQGWHEACAPPGASTRHSALRSCAQRRLGGRVAPGKASCGGRHVPLKASPGGLQAVESAGWRRLGRRTAALPGIGGLGSMPCSPGVPRPGRGAAPRGEGSSCRRSALPLPGRDASRFVVPGGAWCQQGDFGRAAVQSGCRWRGSTSSHLGKRQAAPSVSRSLPPSRDHRPPTHLSHSASLSASATLALSCAAQRDAACRA